MRDVIVEPKPTEIPVTIITRPFFLQNLICLCLDFAMDAVGEGNTIDIISEKTETGAQIRIRQIKSLARTVDKFPAERETALLDALKSDLAADVGTGELVITLPRDINA